MSSAGLPITGSGAVRGAAALNRERRSWERYLLGEAEGILLQGLTAYLCRFIDISLGGCCIHTERPFAAGALVEVEIVLLIHGMTLRLGGVTQWTSKGNAIGIRFIHRSAQSKNQLAALLTCLIDRSVAEAIHDAETKAPGEKEIAADLPSDVHHEDPPGNSLAAESHLNNELPVMIRFLKDGSQIAGIIADLSADLNLDDCTVRMTLPFNLGIYARVEICFLLRGFTFQLAAVSQEIYDKRTVNFRFLEVSSRKREELAQAIEEIRSAKLPLGHPGVGPIQEF